MVGRSDPFTIPIRVITIFLVSLCSITRLKGNMTSSSAAAAILQQDLVNQCDEYQRKPWSARLPFRGHACFTKEELFQKPLEEELDLFRYVEGTNPAYGRDSVICFDPHRYMAADSFLKGSAGQRLLTDLTKASKHHGGCLLFSNGGQNKKSRALRCCHYRPYQGSKSTSTEPDASLIAQ